MIKKTVPSRLCSLVLFVALSLVTADSSPAAKGGKGGGSDRKPPVIEILNPADGQEVSDPSLVVAAIITDNVGVVSTQLSVNSSQPIALSLDGDGNFNAGVTLQLGNNTLTVTAEDAAGNRADASRQVVYRVSSDLITILSPADGDVIHAGSIDIVGTFDPSVETIYYEMQPAVLGGDKFRVVGADLREGATTLTVKGLDVDGNMHETSVAVEVTSTVAPIVVTIDPPGGPVPLDVTFSIENNTSETITSYEVDFENSGNFIPAPGGIDGLMHTYERAGLFPPPVRVATAEGHQFTAYGIVSAHGPAQHIASFPAVDPVDIASDREGKIFVLERSAARVRVLDEEGVELASFGSAGSGPGEFSEPSGIDVDSEGNIYVADTGNDRVQIFSPVGEYVRSVGRSGNKIGEISRPEGVAIEYNGLIAVADTANSHVDWFRNHGYFENAIGSGTLVDPGDLLWTGGGDLTVSDRATGKILVFSKSGSARPWVQEPPLFGSPAGMELVRGGTPWGDCLLVADEANDRITMMITERSHAIFLRHIDELTGDATGLSRPMAVAKGSSQVEDIYFVADNGNNRIVKVLLPVDESDGPPTVWGDVRTALAAGDVAGAALHFSPTTREIYREMLTAAGDQLPAIVADMGDLLPLSMEGSQAVYGVLRYDDGKPYLFNIVFERDSSGDWKILNW
jgi:hypothetical protein